MIREGHDGLLVRYTDEEDLADATKALLRDPGLRREMGERGRRKTLARYTWDAVTDRFREVYRSAIRGNC